jgi:hypothetical protein
MEVQEQAINTQSKHVLEELTASLTEVFPLEELPKDIQDLLDQLYSIDFCREIALDQASARVSRLLSNTANQAQ